MKRVPRPYLPVPTTDGRLVRKSQLLEIALVAQTPPKKDRGPTLSLRVEIGPQRQGQHKSILSFKSLFSSIIHNLVCVCLTLACRRLLHRAAAADYGGLQLRVPSVCTVRTLH